MIDTALHRVRLLVRPFVPARFRHRLTRLALACAAAALRGSRVRCPCCGRGFRRFLAYPSSLCPGCGSYERQRLLCLYFAEHAELLEARPRILHVAPEDCIRDVVRRARPRDYLSIDLEYPGAMRRMDVTRLELEDRSRDLILVSHVLDIVPDVPRACRELHRVLAPNGVAIVQPPGAASDNLGLHAALTAAGLDVTTESIPAQADEETARRYGLLADERLLVGRRPSDQPRP